MMGSASSCPSPNEMVWTSIGEMGELWQDESGPSVLCIVYREQKCMNVDFLSPPMR